MEKIGLALYSFGMDSKLDMEEKLHTAAEIGYTAVEFAMGYGGLEAPALRRLLERFDLEGTSSHVGYNDIDNHLALMHEIGGRMIIVPGHAFANREETLVFADMLNRKGRETAKYGLKLGYHNHTSEFFVDQGKPLMDHLIENTDPDLVGFELDCGWASAAGMDPVEYLNRHAGRFLAIHLKENDRVTGPDKPRSMKDKAPQFELDANGKPIIPEEFRKMMEAHGRMNVATGKGIVNWRRVLTAAESQGCLVRFVEREWSYNEPQDRVACLREDHAYLSML